MGNLQIRISHRCEPTSFVFFDFGIMFFRIDELWCFARDVHILGIPFLNQPNEVGQQFVYLINSSLTLESCAIKPSKWRWAPSACLRAAEESAICRAQSDKRVIRRLMTLRENDSRVHRKKLASYRWHLQPEKESEASDVEVSLGTKLFHVCIDFSMGRCQVLVFVAGVFADFADRIYRWKQGWRKWIFVKTVNDSYRERADRKCIW